MTDYLYSFSLASQTHLFLLSLGFGFFTGLVYSLFCGVRIFFKNSKTAFRITDFFFLLTLAFLNFLFFLTFNEGKIRFFAFLGEALGFTVYIFTVNFTVKAFFQGLFNAVRRFLTTVLKAVTLPIRKLVKKYLKIPKKFKNKSKYPLKVKWRLLYNLTNRKLLKQSTKRGVEKANGK